MLGINRSDQLTSGVGSPESTDHARRLSNVARYGTVAEADYTGATAGFPAIRVQLQDGEILSDWVPWFTPRAGKDRVWDPPEVGEVVMLLAPSGELANGVAIPGLFSNGNANGDRAGLQRRTFEDGTVIEYDRQAHKLLLDVKGDMQINATGDVGIEASGNLTLIGERIDLNPPGEGGGSGGSGGGSTTPPAASSLQALQDVNVADKTNGSLLYYDAAQSKFVTSSVETTGAFLTLNSAQTVSGNKEFTGNVSVPTQFVSDNSTKAASTAFVKAQGYITDNKPVTVSGDATGSGATSIALTLASIGTAGEYTKVTTDAKGRVISGTNPTTLTGYGITDAATSTHGHGNITNAGAIGTTANLPVITTISGVLTAGSFGTTANTFCQGNDARLSDTRNTTNAVTFNNGGAGAASGSTFNGGSAITVSYNTVGAPSTTGANASGTWGINITGSAGSTSYPSFSGDAVSKDDITTRTDSGFYQTISGTTAEGWPLNDNLWQHLIACTHSNDSNYYSMQIASSFYSQNWYFRNTNGSGTTGWSTMLHSGNYTSYAQPKTSIGSGAPTSTPANGTMHIDQTNLRLYVRVNDAWTYTQLGQLTWQSGS